MKIKEIMANVYYKGKETVDEANEMYDTDSGCPKELPYGLCISSEECENNGCFECFEKEYNEY